MAAQLSWKKVKNDNPDTLYSFEYRSNIGGYYIFKLGSLWYYNNDNGVMGKMPTLSAAKKCCERNHN